MLPVRRLLYHRGLDDNSGTYITDYVFAGACSLLCIQLFLRIQKEKKRLPEEHTAVTSCYKIANWMPWNWPKRHPTAVSMISYGLLLVGLSNSMMALLGGLAHQYVQTVEAESDHHSNFPGWLTVWRFAASFSAVMCLGLAIMTEQLIVQERIFPIHRIVRRIYYVLVFFAFVGFFLYNFHPLMKDVEDPFSIGKSFLVCFAVMFLYGICTIILLLKYYCCCSPNESESENTVDYSPSHSVGNTSPVKTPYRKDLYDCCKSVAGGYRENVGTLSSRNLELILTASSPWIYVFAGVINHLLKSKCSDSDDAAGELGCPLPNSFNHNALMHVIQIFSLAGFFVAENLSMTRRRLLSIRISESNMKRTRTSSTIYNDVMSSCTMTTDGEVNEKSPLKEKYLNNNNEPMHNRDDVVCVVASKNLEETIHEIISSPVERGVIPLPRFPTETDVTSPGQRISVYDNMALQNV